MEEEINMQEAEDVSLSGLESIESGPDLDVQQYEGKQAAIEKVNVMVFMSKYGIDGKTVKPGDELFMPSLKVETIPLFTTLNSEGEEYGIRASELFSLKVKDKSYPELVKGLGKNPDTFLADKEKALEIAKNMIKEKKIGWSEHEKGALRKFLKKLRVTHPKDLLGKNVLIITRAGKEDNVFLGFVKE